MRRKGYLIGLITFVLCLSFVATASAEGEFTLSAPEAVDAGSPIEISVDNDLADRDFITIVSPDTKEGKYKNYKYPKKKKAVELNAPDVAGTYEIRLMSGESGYPTLATKTLTVNAVTASLTAPSEIGAGAEIEIEWSGPANKSDFVTIVEKGTKEGKYARYVYPKNYKGKALELRAPDLPGEYELRYYTGGDRLTLASSPITVIGVEATLEAPESAKAGDHIEVLWKGPDNKGDYITIVEQGAKEGKYGAYKYVKGTSDRKPLSIRVPETAGEYEIRYLTGQKKLTLGSLPLTVTGVEASLKAPEQIKAGNTISIEWEGPDNKGDFITIVEKGTKEGKSSGVKYVKYKQGPRELPIVEVRAPEIEGEYEIRYVTGSKKLTLASVPLLVTGVTAELKAPEELVAGSVFEVEWEGPDNKGDFITIVAPDDKEGKTGKSFRYVYHRQGPKELPIVNLSAPEDLGTYEIRYVSGGKRLTLGMKEVQVVEATASIDAPKEATSKEVMKVSWEGPGNPSDMIVIIKPDAAEGETKRWVYASRGKDLKMKAPVEPGEYQIQYRTAKKKTVLASEPLTVVASKVPGSLSVVAASEVMEQLSTEKMNVALILDASGSMLKQQGGKRRIEIAKDAVTGLIKDSLDEGTPFSMRVFGHKEKDSCRTDLEIPLAPLDESEAVSTVKNIGAMNYAKTPIAKSLELIKEDLAAAEGYRVVVLVTDGEETCDGDPKKAIQDLMDEGFETRVNIVGFAIDEYMLKETFKEWARVGNGTYFDARNASELKRSIAEAIETPYEVIDKDDQVVASGVVNGESLELLPGSYTVRVLSKPVKTQKVEVESEKRNTVKLAG